jgi:hypothetical protein
VDWLDPAFLAPGDVGGVEVPGGDFVAGRGDEVGPQELGHLCIFWCNSGTDWASWR